MAVEWTGRARSALVGCATAIGVVALGVTALAVIVAVALSNMDWQLFELRR